jgi:anti-sigma B factor antagonist
MTAEILPGTPSSTGGAPWSFRVVAADPLYVAVGGEIDTLTGPLVLAELLDALEASSGPVQILLDEVTFIDSQGLTALISAQRADPDRPMTLAGARPNVRRLIEITGLDQLFTVE